MVNVMTSYATYAAMYVCIACSCADRQMEGLTGGKWDLGMYRRTRTVEHSAAHLSRTVHCLCKGVPLEAVHGQPLQPSPTLFKPSAVQSFIQNGSAPQRSTKSEDTDPQATQ